MWNWKLQLWSALKIQMRHLPKCLFCVFQNNCLRQSKLMTHPCTPNSLWTCTSFSKCSYNLLSFKCKVFFGLVLSFLISILYVIIFYSNLNAYLFIVNYIWQANRSTFKALPHPRLWESLLYFMCHGGFAVAMSIRRFKIWNTLSTVM